MSGEPAPVDWSSAEGAQEFVDFHKGFVSRRFNDTGQISPVALLLGTRDPKTRLTFKGGPQLMVITAAQFSTDAHRDGYSEGIRQLAKRSSAIAALFITEGWQLRTRTKEAYEDYRLYWTGRLSEHPDRMEVVQLVWQHRALGNGSAVAEILRPADMRPHLAPWTDISSITHPELEAAGRFTNFLPSEDT